MWHCGVGWVKICTEDLEGSMVQCKIMQCKKLNRCKILDYMHIYFLYTLYTWVMVCPVDIVNTNTCIHFSILLSSSQLFKLSSSQLFRLEKNMFINDKISHQSLPGQASRKGHSPSCQSSCHASCQQCVEQGTMSSASDIFFFTCP